MKFPLSEKIKIFKEKGLQIKNLGSQFVDYCGKTLETGGKERNRLLVIFFTFLFLLDYVLYCVHIEKIPFNIFPPFPVFETTLQVTVYLPSPDGSTIIEEKRKIPVFDNETKQASYLFNVVRNGSIYENTIAAVPVDLQIKDIWFHEEGGSGIICTINIDPVIARPEVQAAKGSEELFKNAVEKTITGIMPSIKKVSVQERGVPGKKLWEI